MKKEILRAGKFIDMHGQKVTITQKLINEIASNFTKNTEKNSLGKFVPLTVGHPFSGDAQAFAWVGDLFVEGKKLIANLVKVSKKGEEYIKGFTFRDVSSSLQSKEKDGSGIRNILNHVALTNFPAVGDLADFELSSFSEISSENLTCLTACEEETDDKSESFIDSIKETIINQFQHFKQNNIGDPMPENTNIELEGLKGQVTAFESQVTSLTSERDEFKAQFETVNTELTELKATIEAEKVEAADNSDIAFCDKLIKDGKMLPAKKDATLGTLKDLRGRDSFEAYKKDLEGRPKLSEFENLDTEGLNNESGEGALENRTRQIVKEQGLNFSQALTIAKQEIK